MIEDNYTAHINKAEIEERLQVQDDPKNAAALLAYIGSRTVAEFRLILSRKRKYYAILRERSLLPPTATAADIEVAAFFLAADDLRKNRPHKTEILIAIDREKRAREDGAPSAKTLIGKIYRDFEDIKKAREAGATWTDVARALKKKSCYRGQALDPSVLSHTYLKIQRSRAAKEAANNAQATRRKSFLRTARNPSRNDWGS